MDGQPFNEKNMLPSKIGFCFEVSRKKKNGFLEHPIDYQLSLQLDCDPSTLVWNDKLQSDVAAYEISDLVPPEDTPYAWHLDNVVLPTFPLGVMQELFIIGYPQTVLAKETDTPIYKSATVASEPESTIAKGYFLADGKTKSGMSGSPVIWRKGFDAFNTQGEVHKEEIYQPYLVGVYSGRDEADPELYTAELGRVWHLKAALTDLL